MSHFYWQKALDQKIKRFNTEKGKIEALSFREAGLDVDSIQARYIALVTAGVDCIELPTRIDLNEIQPAFTIANGFTVSTYLSEVDDPVFEVPTGFKAFSDNLKGCSMWLSNGLVLVRCVNKEGQYIRNGGEGFKERQARLEREEQERLAREAEEKRIAAEKAEKERQAKNLSRLMSLDQVSFEKLIKSVSGN